MPPDKKVIGARLRELREEPLDRHGRAHRSREKWAMTLRAAAGPAADDLPHVPSLAKMIQQWERGDHVPGPMYRPLYAKATGKTEEELFGARLPPADRARPDQRHGRLRRGLDEALTAGAMPPRALDDWDLTVLRHGEATRERPAIALVEDLADDLAELNHALKRHRSVTTTVRLTRVVAQMAGLMCLTLIKLDDRTAFRQWARTARIAAAEVGDPDTHSWVLAQEAYGHFYAADFTEAITVSRAAWEVSEMSVGAALAAALEARAQAALGPAREEETREALRRAESVLARLGVEAVNASAFGYNEGQLRFHEGNAFTHLGNTAAAWEAQQRALELCPLGDYMDRTLTHLDRTLCLVREGDSTGALEVAAEALEPLDDRQRQGIISFRGREVLNALPPRQQALAPAKQLRELLTPPPEGETT